MLGHYYYELMETSTQQSSTCGDTSIIPPEAIFRSAAKTCCTNQSQPHRNQIWLAMSIIENVWV